MRTIEIVKAEIEKYGVAVDGKIISNGFLDYEAVACKKQLELLDPETLDEVLEKIGGIK